MTRPFFSIVIPFLNVEEYIAECIQSLKDQTFSDFEAIFIDDGSTDTSVEIFKDLTDTDPRFKLIQHSTNKGEATGRNEGIDVAVGEFILFFDSDDFFSLNTLQAIHDEIERYEADIVVFGGDTVPAGACEWAEKAMTIERAVHTDVIKALFDVQGSRPYAANKAYRLSLIKEHRCYFGTDIKIGLDHVFQFDTFPYAKRISYIPDTLRHYRVWDGSVMGSVSEDETKKLHQHVHFVDTIVRSWSARGLLRVSKNRRKLSNWVIEYLFDDMMRHMDSSIVDGFREMLQWFDSGLLFEKDLEGVRKSSLRCMRNLVEMSNQDTSAPIVTVIVPISNIQADLEEHLFALRRQLETSMEVIMVYDSANGDAYNTAFAFAGYDPRFILLKAMLPGLSAAKNQGLDAARGKYILFLDSDNFFDIEMTETMVEAAESSAADICVVLARGENASHTHLYRMPWSCNGKYAPMNKAFSAQDIPNTIFQFTTPEIWNKLFRTAFLRSHRLRFSGDRETDSISFVMSALACAHIIIALDSPSLNHRFYEEDPSEAALPYDPFSIFQDLLALKEKLSKDCNQDLLLSSFGDFALDCCLEALHAQNEPIVFEEFYTFLQTDGFKVLGLSAGAQKPKTLSTRNNYARMEVILQNPVDVYRKKWDERITKQLVTCDRPTSRWDLIRSKAQGALRRTRRTIYQLRFR